MAITEINTALNSINAPYSVVSTGTGYALRYWGLDGESDEFFQNLLTVVRVLDERGFSTI